MAVHDSSMTLFTEESMKKNKMSKKHKMDCKIHGDMIEYDDGGNGWKHTIRLNELDEVEMNEKFTINKHKYEHIICLKRGKDIKFLKADSRGQMEQWYNLLMKALTRFGWIDAEPESTIEGTKRRATNPEGMKRPNRTKTISAYGGLEGNFYMEPNRPITESPEVSTDSDESSNDSPTEVTATPIYEDRLPTAPMNHQSCNTVLVEQDHTYVNVHGLNKPKPPVPVRKESMRVQATTRPRVPVESDESQYMALLPKTEPTSSTFSSSANYQPTKDTGFRADLENILSQGQGPPLLARKPSATMNKYSPVSSVAQHVKDTKPGPVEPISKPRQREENPTEGIASITRKTKSFRTPNPQPHSTLQRKASFQLPMPSPQKTQPDVVAAARPQLPRRNGKTLKSSIENFRKCQEEESMAVNLNREVVSNGKRLCLVKVQGLGYIWIDHWNPKGSPLEETIHPGDQILSINGIDLENCEVAFAYDLMAKIKEKEIHLTVRRAPYAHVLHIQRTAECQDLGIEIDGNVIKKVSHDGLFNQASRSKTIGVLSTNLVEWTITEINMQPINFNHTTEQIKDLLATATPYVALVIQPADLIRAMKDALTCCPMCGTVAHSHD